ncbi:MAG TPA: NAD-dependent epimerase/dehydratase family protein, partial [Ardenticatenaceae bacterium]|nr:NAD-dependent epimerase/dehydratase family protein [Ardenticatenaceae bacterium]
LSDETITVFGNGLQVRDVLYVDDLVSAFLLARDNAAELRGQAFNMGGGPRNTVSLLELLEQIRTLCGREPRVRFEPSRVGDQRYYVSSFQKFRALTGWAPAVAVNDGLRKLHDWLLQSASALSRARAETDPRPLPSQSTAAQAS